ncbi:MAG: TIGR00341 family protein [Sandaracinaceae bacterium]|nr:MAG: TIGR00341 family protein [Sandaracinaceae bacterium]
MAEPREDAPKGASTRLRTALDFLVGSELDAPEGEPRPEALPGVFSFMRERWSQDAGGEGGAKEGTFARYRRLRKAYEAEKERQVGNFRVYESIAQASRLSKEFLALLFSACLIATFGLFASSTATIIGAMLIAPLMMPILGFALGSIWGDTRLLWRSIGTLGAGTAMVLVVSALLAAIVPGVEVTPEMAARTNPSLYDLLVAVGSGLIGAYAFVNPRISPSIAGVAIAVALMPPLCTVGIGIGLGDASVASGATLLYLSNLIGISLAASFIFWRLRVHPYSADEKDVGSRAKRNVTVSTVLVVVIALPLAWFMKEAFDLRQHHAAVRAAVVEELGDATVLSLDVQPAEAGHRVSAVLVVDAATSPGAVAELRERITAEFPDGVELSLVTMRSEAASALRLASAAGAGKD